MWDPAHFVMVRRLLEGIKERAEGRPLVPDGVQFIAHIGWLIAGAGLLAVFAAHRRWWLWLGVPALVLVPSYVAARDVDSIVAGFLAIGITIVGALAFGRRWWPAYLLIASFVLLTLLLAPDAYAAFGPMLLVLEAAIAVAAAYRVLADAVRHRRTHISPAPIS